MPELLLSSSSSWIAAARAGPMATSAAVSSSSMAGTAAAALPEGASLFVPRSLRSGGGATPVHHVGRCLQAHSAGLAKGLLHRMQPRKLKRVEKARLPPEKRIFEARRFAEIQAVLPVLEMVWQSLSRGRQSNHFGSDEQIANYTIKEGTIGAKAGVLCQTCKMELQQGCCSNALFAALLNIIAIPCFSGVAHAEVFDKQIRQIYGDLGAGLDIGLQVLYLAALLCLVGVASYFVVRQVLIRRDLESAARDLQDRVRSGQALPVEYFELGAVMLRKRFYNLASRYLEQAIDKWDGDPQELAQVHNALGFSYANDNNIDEAIEEYETAVKLQPGYVVAWNNLGSAYEKKKDLTKALEAYEKAVKFDPNNPTAKEYRDALKERVKRLKGVSLK